MTMAGITGHAPWPHGAQAAPSWDDTKGDGVVAADAQCQAGISHLHGQLCITLQAVAAWQQC
jgi:hypothetical protein